MAKKAVEITKFLVLDLFFVKVFASAVKHLKRTDESGKVYRGIRFDMYQTKKDLKAILMAAGILEHADWAKTNISCHDGARCNACIECALLAAKDQAVKENMLYYREVPRPGKKDSTFNFLYTPEEWNPTKNVDREMLDTVIAEARTA